MKIQRKNRKLQKSYIQNPQYDCEVELYINGVLINVEDSCLKCLKAMEFNTMQTKNFLKAMSRRRSLPYTQ